MHGVSRLLAATLVALTHSLTCACSDVVLSYAWWLLWLHRARHHDTSASSPSNPIWPGQYSCSAVQMAAMMRRLTFTITIAAGMAGCQLPVVHLIMATIAVQLPVATDAPAQALSCEVEYFNAQSRRRADCLPPVTNEQCYSIVAG